MESPGRSSPGGAARSLPEQILLPEHHRRPEQIILVLLLGEAVALVLADQIPDVGAARPDRFHYLVGLRFRNPRVIGPLDDIERRANLADPAERRDLEQLGALFGVALVAIFGSAQVAAIALRVLEEADEVGDGDVAQSALEAGRVEDPRGVAHVAAVASAGDRHPLRVEARIADQPVEERADVADRILALERAVVEVHEALAVSGRAA